MKENIASCIEVRIISGGIRWVRAYNETSIEPDICLLDISRLVNHLADEGKDAEEGNGLDHSGVAEQEDLEFGNRLLVMSFGAGCAIFVVEDFAAVDGSSGLINAATEERCAL